MKKQHILYITYDVNDKLIKDNINMCYMTYNAYKSNTCDIKYITYSILDLHYIIYAICNILYIIYYIDHMMYNT